MKRLILFILCFSCGLAFANTDALFSTLPDDMAEAKVPGLAIVTIEDGKIARQRAFGTTRLGTGDPLSLNDVFEAASLGKMVAAYRLFMLIETGVITLDDPVNDDRIVSECGQPTIANILSHSAGFGNNIEADVFEIDCDRVGDFSYGGEGFVALESVFEQAVGVPSELDLQQSIFTPLGMEHSTMGSSSTKVVAGHPDLLFALLSDQAETVDKDLIWIAALGAMLIFVALTAWIVLQFRPFVATVFSITLFLLFATGFAGFLATSQATVSSTNKPNDIASSMKTTAPDMARFAIELMKPTLVSRRTLEEMFTPAETLNRRIAWGYGIGIDNSMGAGTYWHWGSNPGYQSLFVIEPENQRGVVILTNGGGFSDFLIDGRGGYDLARDLVVRILEIEGHWMITEPE